MYHKQSFRTTAPRPTAKPRGKDSDRRYSLGGIKAVQGGGASCVYQLPIGVVARYVDFR
jgi:hypothetical protein